MEPDLRRLSGVRQFLIYRESLFLQYQQEFPVNLNKSSERF
jgi:hypothetical protein